MRRFCSDPECRSRVWMRAVLVAAGLCNLVFAGWLTARPGWWCGTLALTPPGAPMLVQGGAMILGVLGIGYLIASLDPLRHWALVLVGFLAKFLGTLGLLGAAFGGALPPAAAWIALGLYLPWWFPFGGILWAATKAHLGGPVSRKPPLSVEKAAARFTLSSGESLLEASRGCTLALVFLRHFGCTFTRQLLRHLEQLQGDVESRGGRLVLVHMLERGQDAGFLDPDARVARIADPACRLYRAFGLGKGTFWELLGPVVWVKGFLAFFSGCGAGHLAGDGLQMPGAFLFRDGRIISAQPARNAAQLPDIRRLFQSVA